MTREYVATFSIASLYAVRMFGLFMILPTFSLFAKQYSLSLTHIGIALGSYGLAQALCQIPFGFLSDKFGRKNMLFSGYILFTLGSFVAFGCESFWGLLLGRVLQGSGAVGGVLLALVSDITAEQKKSMMMAVVGVFIGASFIIAIPLGSWIAHDFGAQYIFLINAISGIAACLIVPFLPSATSANIYQKPLATLRHSFFSQFNLGIMLNHSIQMMLWVAVPVVLVTQFNISKYYFYLIILAIVGFIFMVPLLRLSNNRPKQGLLFVLVLMSAAIAGIALAETNLLIFTISILAFLTAFSFFESKLPALASSQCNFAERGMKMGIFSSWQFMGIFIGSWLGGYLVQNNSMDEIYILIEVMLILWMGIVYFSTIHQYKSVRVAPKENVDFKTLRSIKGVQDVVFIKNYKAYYVKVDKNFDCSKLG